MSATRFGPDTFPWKAEKTNAGTALRDAQGNCLCWEWDADAEVVEEILRRVNAHDDLIAALEAMGRTHGMHGPCEQNSCKACCAAFDQAREAIAKAKGD